MGKPLTMSPIEINRQAGYRGCCCAHKTQHKTADMRADMRTAHKPLIKRPIPTPSRLLHQLQIASAKSEDDTIAPEPDAIPLGGLASLAPSGGQFSLHPL